jgi:hypothetical protein
MSFLANGGAQSAEPVAEPVSAQLRAIGEALASIGAGIDFDAPLE